METRKAKSIEEVERIVNTKGLNNVDLNNDGEIDYIHIAKLSGIENQGRTLEFYVLDGKERINIVKAKYKVSTQNKSGEAVSSSNEAKYNFEDIPKSDEIAEGQLVCYLIIYTKEHPVVIEDKGFTVRSCVLGNYAKEVTDTTQYDTNKDSQFYRSWVPWAVVGTSVFVGAVGVYHMRSYWRHNRRSKKTEGVDSKKTNPLRKNYRRTSPVRSIRRSNGFETQRKIRTTEGVRSSRTKSRTRSTRSFGK